jgi:hypothetical protein
MNQTDKKVQKLLEIFFKAWSKESSSKYTPDNPAKGQCGVTSLVVQDLLGGEIVKTKLPEGWHFYNKIDGKYYDLTKSQFQEEIVYMHLPSIREESFMDTNEAQYRYLKESVLKYWRTY